MNRFFTDFDNYLFSNGTHYELYNKMGAHLDEVDGVKGVRFVLWAPNAKSVSIVSDGNGWTPFKDNMVKINDSVWELFVPGMIEGVKYKYHIVRKDGSCINKTDPYGFSFELRPNNASIVTCLDKYKWEDKSWVNSRKKDDYLTKPMSVYEVHLGSWQKDYWRNDEHHYYNYRDIAPKLCEYVCYMGYTHIELMGILEYPFEPSWGYQVTGYYAPTKRYGTPEDFMFFVDYMHKHGIGVILDWVPAHFPKDDFALAKFDGTPLYEYADPLRAEYPEWGTLAFDLGKKEVVNFLIASAFFWINKYHIDHLRVDAVAAMLSNNFSREKWRPNIYGGTDNLESFEFFKHLNSVIREKTNSVLIAEDSSITENVTKRAEDGGLGFGLKWNMGWMNENCRYMHLDPIYRKYHHDLITHSFSYDYTEHFMLVLSHDEVVYGKGSLINKLPGNDLDKFGQLKTWFTIMFGHPGKKLLFMGQDFAQAKEWDYQSELDWYLCDKEGNRDVMNCLRALLKLYKERPVLYDDSEHNTFEWVSSWDRERSIVSFIRRNPWNYNNALIFVCNFSPVCREQYAVGAPIAGKYKRVFSTYPDGSILEIEAENRLCDGRNYAIPFTLKPFESIVFECPYVEDKIIEIKNKKPRNPRKKKTE